MDKYLQKSFKPNQILTTIEPFNIEFYLFINRTENHINKPID